MVFPTKKSFKYTSHRIVRDYEAPEIEYYILQNGTLNKNAPWHIILQGSSLESVSPAKFDAEKSSKQILATELAAHGVPVVLIEKAGICAQGKNQNIVNHYNTIDYRAQDLRTVASKLHSESPERSFVLIGASEGAEVVLRAANHIEKVESIILIAWVTEQSPKNMIVSYLLQKYSPNVAGRLIRPAIRWYVQKKIKLITTDPNSSDTMWLGNSYRYWASFLNQNPKTILSYKNTDLLIIHGSNDLLIEGNERLMRELQLSTEASVTWLRYAEAGHRLPLNEVTKDCIRWLEKNRKKPNT